MSNAKDMSILISDTTIVSSKGIVNGDIYIEGNRIEVVGKVPKEMKVRAEEKIKGSKKIVIPGLVNTHTHLSMTCLRGYGEDLPLHEWLEQKIWPAESKQTEKDIRTAARLAFCEMIRSGTTSFADMCIFDPKPIFTEAENAGLRGTIARGTMDFGDIECGKKQLKEIEKSLSYKAKIVRPSVSAHATFTCSEEFLIKTKELADEYKLKYQIHVSETRKEVFEVLKMRGKYPYEYLESIGLMDSDSIFIHGGWLTRKEIELAGKHKISMASCPVSNLKLATGGIAQLAELDSVGANVCLGTDSAVSNNSLNMFETMKFAALLQKHHYWKADAISAEKAFTFATEGGARALGERCGIIAPGMLADIIMLEKSPNLSPQTDIMANLVYAASPANVSDVIVNGKFVLKNRKLITIDEEKVMEEAEKISLSKTKSI